MAISTHVLDASRGRPASGIPVALSRLESGKWVRVGGGTTDADGRCKNLLDPSADMIPCVYRIRFETDAYYDRMGSDGLYPYVEVAFQVAAGQPHYHIPLLLTPYSYTTYRGS